MSSEGNPAARRSRPRRLSRTLLVSLALTLSGGLLIAIGTTLTKAFGVLLLVFAFPVFAVSAVRHLLRGLLWRVGSRLLVSYLLIGVVPLPFLFSLALASAYVVSGQLAARRALDAFLGRASVLERLARDVAEGASPGDVRAAHAADLPGLSVAASRDGQVMAVGTQVPVAHGGASEGTRTVILRSKGGDALFCTARSARGTAALSLPLEKPLATALVREAGVPVGFLEGQTSRAAHGTEIHLGAPDREGKAHEVWSEEKPADGTGVFRGRWVTFIAPVPFDVVDGSTGAVIGNERAVLVVRTSMAGEGRRLFSGATWGDRDQTDTAVVVVAIMKGLATIVVMVYLAASLLSALLVLRIARATRRLSLGLAAIERGDFTYRARMKGRDQLADLVRGFNEMAEHLSASVAARAEREALEREMELARTLQRRLLPSSDFRFPGLEIVADFRPAAAIGGDFYHLLAESETRLSVVIADVSGHGLPTGIVMASAKASLSALAATGIDAPGLLVLLDEEIRRSTDSRTFVTLAHLRFDLAKRTVSFTNAGHVYPWVVRAGGAVASVSNPARPLGLGLPVTFRTVTSPLEDGDLWVLASDGIVEACSPEGEEIGYERLEELIAEGAGGTAAALAARILDAWRAHTGREEPEDDRTLLVLRVVGAKPVPA